MGPRFSTVASLYPRPPPPAKFTKLDFTSTVLAKQLDSRDQVMRYVQDFGTTAMQLFARGQTTTRRLTDD